MKPFYAGLAGFMITRLAVLIIELFSDYALEVNPMPALFALAIGFLGPFVYARILLIKRPD